MGRRRYWLWRPASVDDLISEEDFAVDERIPYWADCWPSARVLAEHIAGSCGGGRRMLELGCGVGLVSLAAAAAGFDVLATDYYADALEFTRWGFDEVLPVVIDRARSGRGSSRSRVTAARTVSRPSSASLNAP